MKGSDTVWVEERGIISPQHRRSKLCHQDSKKGSPNFDTLLLLPKRTFVSLYHDGVLFHILMLHAIPRKVALTSKNLLQMREALDTYWNLKGDTDVK